MDLMWDFGWLDLILYDDDDIELANMVNKPHQNYWGLS